MKYTTRPMAQSSARSCSSWAVVSEIHAGMDIKGRAQRRWAWWRAMDTTKTDVKNERIGVIIVPVLFLYGGFSAVEPSILALVIYQW